MPIFKLNEKLRKGLKKPFGNITSFEEISKAPDKMKGRIIICVGDKTCELALKHGLNPKICVYDSLNLRKKISVPNVIKNYNADEIKIKNSAGELNSESFDAVSSAIKSKNNVKIIVEGEEDLITLAAIDVAPEKSIILYGQPNEGLVMVEVDGKIKAEVSDILNRMKETRV